MGGRRINEGFTKVLERYKALGGDLIALILRQQLILLIN